MPQCPNVRFFCVRFRTRRALGRLGVDRPQSLPAIAFANAPHAELHRADRPEGAFERAWGRGSVIAGAADQLMDAAAYESALSPLGAPVTVLPGVDHMGVCYLPEAIKGILAAFAE